MIGFSKYPINDAGHRLHIRHSNGEPFFQHKTFGIGNTDFILCASQLVRVLLVDRWLGPLWANFGFLQLLKYLEMVFGFGKVAKFGKNRTQ